MQISNSKMQYIGSIAYPGAQPLRIFKSPGPGTQEIVVSRISSLKSIMSEQGNGKVEKKMFHFCANLNYGDLQ